MTMYSVNIGLFVSSIGCSLIELASVVAFMQWNQSEVFL